MHLCVVACPNVHWSGATMVQEFTFLTDWWTDLSEGWQIAFVGLFGTALLALIGWIAQSLFRWALPANRPKISVAVDQLPARASRKPPHDLKAWEHFDTGETPLRVRIENIGNTDAVLRGVMLHSRGRPALPLQGHILQSDSASWQHRGHTIAANDFCDFQASLPSDAFIDSAQLRVSVAGRRKPFSCRVKWK